MKAKTPRKRPLQWFRKKMVKVARVERRGRLVMYARVQWRELAEGLDGRGRGKEARKKARQSLQLWHVQVGSRPSGHAAHQHWVFKVHNCQQANS